MNRKGTVSHRVKFFAGCLIVLLIVTCYFVWEILYQEKVISQILVLSNKEDIFSGQQNDLKDWISLHRHRRNHLLPVDKQNVPMAFQKLLIKSQYKNPSVNSLNEETTLASSGVRNKLQPDIIRSELKHLPPYRAKILETPLQTTTTFEEELSVKSEPFPKQKTINLHRAAPNKKYDTLLSILRKKQVILNTDRDQTLNKHALDIQECSYCQTYDVTQEIAQEYECVNLALPPSPLLCIYPVDKDVYVSQQIKNDGLWEGHILKKFQSVLQNDRTLSVIDVGANIGLYSILAASMGHTVLAVEPYMESVARLHKSIKLNGLEDKITILVNAISDTRGLAKLVLNPNNQGDTRVSSNKDVNSTLTVNSIHLDDLLSHIHFERAVLKVDTQGFEHKIFVHAKQLMDTVYIPCIFMEWVLMRQFYVTDSHMSTDKMLLEDMLDFLNSRNYTPYSLVTGLKLNPKYYYGWSEDVLWKHEVYELLFD